MTDNTNDLRIEIRKVGQKVDGLQLSHETDRNFLKQLHSDHLILGGRVKAAEDHLLKNQSDLQRHIEVASVIQDSVRKDITETKEMLRGHIAQEDVDRKEVIKHMRDSVERGKENNLRTLLWLSGTAVSIVLMLFGLLWATGAVGP
jgi:hypothetical protein